MEKKDNKRIFQYDVMRVTAMIMVLGVHIINMIYYKTQAGSAKYLMQTLNDFFIIANPIFFMIAGKFNLKNKFENKKDYMDYYYKKFVTIFIPFFIISIFQYLIFFYDSLSVQDFIIRFLTDDIYVTNWFMYAYMGLIIFTPFLSKIVNNLNDVEKKLLIIISFLANLFVTYLNIFELEAGITFQYLGLAFWHIFYLSGYIIEDVIKSKKGRDIIIVVGLIAFIIQILIRVFINDTMILTNPSPLLILEAFGAYFFIKEYIKINNDKERKFISLLSKYSYAFYLCHATVLVLLTRVSVVLIKQNPEIIKNIFLYESCMYIITFAIGIIVSIIITKLIFEPIKKILLNQKNNSFKRVIKEKNNEKISAD